MNVLRGIIEDAASENKIRLLKKGTAREKQKVREILNIDWKVKKNQWKAQIF